MRVSLLEDLPGELDDCCAVDKAVSAVKRALPDGHAEEEKEQSPYAAIRLAEAEQERMAAERFGWMLADVERVLRRAR